MNHPGMSCTTEQYNSHLRLISSLTLEQIDLMNPTTRQRFFDKTLRKYDVKKLLVALMEKGVALSDEQMGMLKE